MKTAIISKSHNSNKNLIIWTVILSLILVLIGLISIFIVKRSIALGVNAAETSFSDSFSEAKDSSYDYFRNSAYTISEKANHVSNKVSITISAVKEKSNLEVLNVSDIVYIITDSDETKSGTSSWLKVKGSGVFTVDLNAAEYLVDNDRHYVLVRVPKPILDSKNISIDSAESLHFEENKWNYTNSVQSGESLAREQLSEAQQKIQEDFEASESYADFAKSSAESMISALIKSLNSYISDLTVDVEFY